MFDDLCRACSDTLECKSNPHHFLAETQDPLLLHNTQDRSVSHDTRQTALDTTAFEIASLKAQVSRHDADNVEQRRQIELRTKQSEDDSAALLKRTQAEAGTILQQVGMMQGDSSAFDQRQARQFVTHAQNLA